MRGDTFFKDPNLSYIECRYSERSCRDFKPHLHRRFSIGAVAEGSVIFTHLGQEHLLQPGTLALINPETIHSCNTSSLSGRSYYMLYLDPCWCATLQKTDSSAATFVPIQACNLTDAKIFQRFCMVMERLMDKEIFLLEKEQLVTELVRTIFHATQAEGSFSNSDDKNETEPDIERAKKALAANLHREITLADLALELQANPYTLIRRFKAATGTTPHAFRLNCRIEYARQLLQRGSDIADTAYECGFFDQSHLHRHFRAMTTVTPREYQNNFPD